MSENFSKFDENYNLLNLRDSMKSLGKGNIKNKTKK